MNRRKSLASLAVAMLTVSIGPVAASSAQTSTSYEASYEYDATGAKAQELDETLTLERGRPDAFIKLTNAGGASFDGPTKLGADGEIQTTSNDPGVTCYNMAAATVFQTMHAPGEPTYVYVHAGDGVIRIPLTMSQTKTADGSLVFTGDGQQMLAIKSDDGTVPAQLTVNSSIRMVGDTIMDITFLQTTALGSSDNIISRQSCSLHPQDGPAALT